MDKFTLSYIGVSILLGILAITMRNNFILLSILIMVLVLLKILLVLSINKSIKHVRDNLNNIVSGQLNINVKKSRIKVVNQIGEKINEYVEKTRKLVGQYVSTSEITDKESNSMKNQAENLRITSSEIASTTQNIAEAVNDQAESTARVRNNMGIFAQGVEEIYENAKTSLEVAKDSKVIVDESFETFRIAFEKVEEIKDYNDRVLKDMINLDKSIRQISVITEAVEAIASQTHLLSLNASIEAARAGEAGRGFAVVAGEVSKLADDSSGSAKKIKELVNHIIKEIDDLTSNIKGQTDVINNNTVYAKKALEKSNDINNAVDENRAAAEAIVKLTARQKENIEDITNAIEIINETTQQNAAVSEGITASTEEQMSIIETMYNSTVNLNNAIEHSNSIIGNFVKGFKLTDEIHHQIEVTKKLIIETSKIEGLARMEESKLVQVLKEKQGTLDYIELMAFIDKDGYMAGSTVEVPKEIRNCSARPYFIKAIAGETFVSKEYISTLTNHYNITIAMPIYENNSIAGIILADINLNQN